MAVEELGALVGDELEHVNQRIIEAAANHVELIPTVAKYIIDAGGKRIRPMLTLAAARLCGYQGQRHINLAAAVEFMHTATLLHDDVVDGSHLRRGRDTANHIWGNKSSVLVGDYLLGKAFQMMVADGSLEILRILSDAAAKIAEGEVLQLSTTNNIETTLAQYVEVIEAKTAALFAAACEVGGAIIEDKNKMLALKTFGANFGVAFQIIDDALDYSSTPGKFGKTIGDDFREGKVTLPVIHAYEAGDTADKQFWQNVLKPNYEASEAELSTARDKIQTSGAYEKAIALAKKHALTARNALDIFPASLIKTALLNILEASLNRQF